VEQVRTTADDPRQRPLGLGSWHLLKLKGYLTTTVTPQATTSPSSLKPGCSGLLRSKPDLLTTTTAGRIGGRTPPVFNCSGEVVNHVSTKTNFPHFFVVVISSPIMGLPIRKKLPEIRSTLPYCSSSKTKRTYVEQISGSNRINLIRSA